MHQVLSIDRSGTETQKQTEFIDKTSWTTT